MERILEFVEVHKNQPAPASIGATVWALVEMVPSLNPLLTPVALDLEQMGFGRSFYHQGNGGKLMGHAKNELKHLVVIFEANSAFFRELPDMNPEEDFRRDSDGDASRHTENPFLLEDSDSVSDDVERVLRYLIKMGQSEGVLEKAEIGFVKKTARDMGESLSDEQFNTLVQQVSTQALTDILGGLGDQPTSFKENLLFLGMLSAAIDGHVDISEKKLLAESCPLLHVSKERFVAISKDALAAIKEMQRMPRFSEDTRITVKFLIKVGLTQEGFNEREREFVRQVVGDASETMSDEEFNALVSETSNQSVDTILADVKTRSTAFRENLLLLAMVCSAVDGSVDLKEKHVLARCVTLLGLTREKYSEIAKKALSVIKSVARHSIQALL
jgi:tellurite resistance protein